MRPELRSALDRLYSLRTFGIKPGLDRMRESLAAMGNPERDLAFIHVAGTNGKGSVCAIVESALRHCGVRTALYTSPHLVRLNERIKTAGSEISDDALMDLIRYVGDRTAAVSARMGDITFFEFVTLMAFEHFKRVGVRVAVLETGMGGRLDATNAVTPVLSVITGIGLDHTMYLGDTLEKIAAEKAGIIKQGRPVVCGGMPEEARAVIAAEAAARQAEIVDAADAVSVRRVSQSPAGQKVKISSGDVEYPPALLPLLGRHQMGNCAVAVAALERFASACGVELDPSAVVKGIGATRWPGRCQVLSETPLTILDGAHNPPAGAILAASLRDLTGRKKRRMALVTGMMRDKDCVGFLRELDGLVGKCWAVTVTSERSMPGGELAGIARGLGWNVEEAGLGPALEAARAWAQAEDGFVCIAGSLYLVGEVMELLGLEAGMDGGQHGQRYYASV